MDLFILHGQINLASQGPRCKGLHDRSYVRVQGSFAPLGSWMLFKSSSGKLGAAVILCVPSPLFNRTSCSLCPILQQEAGRSCLSSLAQARHGFHPSRLHAHTESTRLMLAVTAMDCGIVLAQFWALLVPYAHPAAVVCRHPQSAPGSCWL